MLSNSLTNYMFSMMELEKRVLPYGIVHCVFCYHKVSFFFQVIVPPPVVTESVFLEHILLFILDYRCVWLSKDLNNRL
jgi:hypothetical protein